MPAMETLENFRERYLESAAYHEAGHEIAGVVLRIPIRELGLRIDSYGNGVSHTFRRNAGDFNNTPADVLEREQSIVLLSAGYISQLRFFADAPAIAELDDQAQVDALLNEMYPPNSTKWHEAETKLRNDAKTIIEERWPVVEALARALWAKPWTNRALLPVKDMQWSNDAREKWMDAQEVQAVLTPFGLTAIIRSDTEGSYVHPTEERQ
jgi:hypothetical protein